MKNLNEHGVVLVIVLFLAVVMSVFGVYMLKKTGADMKTTISYVDKKKLHYLLEAATEIAYSEYREGYGLAATHDPAGNALVDTGCTAQCTPPILLVPSLKIANKLPEVNAQGYVWGSDATHSFFSSTKTESVFIKIYHPNGFALASREIQCLIEVQVKYGKASAGATVHVNSVRMDRGYERGVSEWDGTTKTIQYHNLHTYIDGDLYLVHTGKSATGKENHFYTVDDSIPIFEVTGKIIRHKHADSGPHNGATYPLSGKYYVPDYFYPPNKVPFLAGPREMTTTKDSDWNLWPTQGYNEFNVIDSRTNPPARILKIPLLQGSDYFVDLGENPCCGTKAIDLGAAYDTTIINQSLAIETDVSNVSGNPCTNCPFVVREPVVVIQRSGLNTFIGNGGKLVYSEKSIVLNHCYELDGAVTIVAKGDIFVLGNFNVGDSTGPQIDSKIKDVALITTHGYFYVLSRNWDISNSEYGYDGSHDHASLGAADTYQAGIFISRYDYWAAVLP